MAPDRIYWKNGKAHWLKEGICGVVEPTEYIRRDAFPVEEIRDRTTALEQNVAVLNTLNRPELNGALGCLETSLQTCRRILSLLEDE